MRRERKIAYNRNNGKKGKIQQKEAKLEGKARENDQQSKAVLEEIDTDTHNKLTATDKVSKNQWTEPAINQAFPHTSLKTISAKRGSRGPKAAHI